MCFKSIKPSERKRQIHPRTLVAIKITTIDKYWVLSQFPLLQSFIPICLEGTSLPLSYKSISSGMWQIKLTPFLKKNLS